MHAAFISSTVVRCTVNRALKGGAVIYVKDNLASSSPRWSVLYCMYVAGKLIAFLGWLVRTIRHDPATFQGTAHARL